MTEPRKLRVFLCHASQDKPVVRELYLRLLAEGWIDPWLDEEKLLPGQDWDMEIEKAVEAADVVFICLSNNSVTKEGYVQRELRFALDIALTKPEETIFVIPLRLEECQPPRRLRGWQYADYFPEKDRERAYQRLLLSLRTQSGKLGIVVASPTSAKIESSRYKPEVSFVKSEAVETASEVKNSTVQKDDRFSEVLEPQKMTFGVLISVILIMLSWALGYSLIAFDNYYILFSAVIGSAVISIVLKQKRIVASWLSILWIMLGFITGPIIGILLGWLDPISDKSYGFAAIGVLSGVVGGYVLGLLLYENKFLEKKSSIFWTTLAWGLGLGVAGSGWAIGWLLAGAIAGAIGGAVTMGSIKK